MPDHFGPIPRRGAPLGNHNAFKHGFYARRINRDLSAEETTNLKSLVDEIALIRVFTRRLVESCHPSADLKELADILRILCLASASITRILRIYYLITGSETGLDPDIEDSIRKINAELIAKNSSVSLPGSAQNDGNNSPSNPACTENGI